MFFQTFIIGLLLYVQESAFKMLPAIASHFSVKKARLFFSAHFLQFAFFRRVLPRGIPAERYSSLSGKMFACAYFLLFNCVLPVFFGSPKTVFFCAVLFFALSSCAACWEFDGALRALCTVFAICRLPCGCTFGDCKRSKKLQKVCFLLRVALPRGILLQTHFVFAAFGGPCGSTLGDLFARQNL